MKTEDFKPFISAMSNSNLQDLRTATDKVFEWLKTNNIKDDALCAGIERLHTALQTPEHRKRAYIELNRVGDFYEANRDSAKILAAVTGITLCTKHNLPFAGFPKHALDVYLPQLIKAGYVVNVNG